MRHASVNGGHPTIVSIAVATSLHIPQRAGTEAQSSSKGRRRRIGRVAVLKRALVNRVRASSRDALAPWAEGASKGRGLRRRARQADGCERKTTALGLLGGRGDGTWGTRRTASIAAAAAKEVGKRLGADGGAAASRISGVGWRRVAVGHGGTGGNGSREGNERRFGESGGHSGGGAVYRGTGPLVGGVQLLSGPERSQERVVR